MAQRTRTVRTSGDIDEIIKGVMDVYSLNESEAIRMLLKAGGSVLLTIEKITAENEARKKRFETYMTVAKNLSQPQ